MVRTLWPDEWIDARLVVCELSILLHYYIHVSLFCEVLTDPTKDVSHATRDLFCVVKMKELIWTMGIGFRTQDTSDQELPLRPQLLQEVHHGDGSTL